MIEAEEEGVKEGWVDFMGSEEDVVKILVTSLKPGMLGS
jgi:hypothetical protein